MSKPATIRQKRIHEIVSNSCSECQFRDHLVGCKVPGGTCCKRRIEGVPGQYVGDILANTGVIMSPWRWQDKQKVEKREGNQEDESNEQ